jgi:hypothetical protein
MQRSVWQQKGYKRITPKIVHDDYLTLKRELGEMRARTE